MERETLEEADKEYERIHRNFKQNFIAGAKWQAENIIEELEMHILLNEDDWNRNPQAQFKKFAEKFKKK
jgi:hypothetical protein